MQIESASQKVFITRLKYLIDHSQLSGNQLIQAHTLLNWISPDPNSQPSNLNCFYYSSCTTSFSSSTQIYILLDFSVICESCVSQNAKIFDDFDLNQIYLFLKLLVLKSSKDPKYAEVVEKIDAHCEKF